MNNNWLDRFHIIRRILLAVFSYVFLNITNHIFFGNIKLDAYKSGAYLFLGGIFTFIVKFYCDTRDKEEKLG